MGGITIQNKGRKHTENNRAITFISKELASHKPQFNGNSHKSTFKRKPLANSTLLLIGTRLFLKTSLAAILICLSGYVESNPGPLKLKNVVQGDCRYAT